MFLDRFLPPFEPRENGECEQCEAIIYESEPSEIVNGLLLCWDCLNASEEEIEEEFLEEDEEDAGTD